MHRFFSNLTKNADFNGMPHPIAQVFASEKNLKAHIFLIFVVGVQHGRLTGDNRETILYITTVYFEKRDV